MPMLSLIADPASYRACIQDLLTDGPVVLDYWLSLFEAHVETLARLPVGRGHLQDQPGWPAFHDDYLAGLGDLRSRPTMRGRLTVLELTIYRDEQLAAHGFVDPFADLKDRENTLALRLLPDLLRDLDAARPAGLGELLARGLFAGNLFDMGSKAVVSQFEAGTFDFLGARQRVALRPWPVDDLDAWLSRLGPSGSPYRQCLFFVDNAGPDILLGVLPFVRDLIGRGTRVVLAANSRPALNDITHTELASLLDSCRRLDARIDDYLRRDQLSIVASGCGSPLIDLSELTKECCDAAGASDLLILEGMGRAIESNYDTRFTVDTLKIALIKDKMVASILGVEMFSPVWRYRSATPCE